MLVLLTKRLQVYKPEVAAKKVVSGDEEDDEDITDTEDEETARLTNENQLNGNTSTSTETTPLINRTNTSFVSSPNPVSPLKPLLLPILLPTILALFIALIPPVKRALTGEGSWIWQVLGMGLGVCGGGFAVVEMLGLGGGGEGCGE